MADVEAMISDLAQLDREDLRRLEEALRRRMQELAGGEESVQYRPDVLEYRPYEDGHLQLETRTYYRRDGSKKTHGPYWYYRFHEGGKQKKIYLGKTDDPAATLAEKRG